MALGPTYLRSLIPRLAREYSSAESAKAALAAAAPNIPLEHIEQLWGEYQAQVALAPVERSRDLRFRPTEGELLEQSVVRGRPFMHEVVIIGRNRAGMLISKRIEMPVEELTSRWRAIRDAEAIAAGTETGTGVPDTELVTIYGGIHVGAYRRRYV